MCSSSTWPSNMVALTPIRRRCPAASSRSLLPSLSSDTTSCQTRSSVSSTRSLVAPALPPARIAPPALALALVLRQVYVRPVLVNELLPVHGVHRQRRRVDRLWPGGVRDARRSASCTTANRSGVSTAGTPLPGRREPGLRPSRELGPGHGAARLGVGYRDRTDCVRVAPMAGRVRLVLPVLLGTS